MIATTPNHLFRRSRSTGCRAVTIFLVGLSLLIAETGARETAAAQPSLKIVVIEGENAVNIIQQKTAVRPVVEVRDRNDLPVSGATVTFTIMGGRTATFASGAQSVTLSTNAAGRAAVSALNPVTSGAVRIQVQAAFQDQTTTTTIVQTNVMTAVQAAQAATATSSGGSGGGGTAGAAGAGGGGLSTTTLAIIGAAAAGGAVLAREVASGPDDVRTYSGPFAGLQVANLGVCSRSAMHTGTVTVNIRTASDGTVTGTGQVSQTRTVTQTTCGGFAQVGYVEMDGCCDPSPQIIGTTANLRFNGSHPGNAGTNWTYDFSGALSGAEITGTFTQTVQSPTAPTFIATFPVTLR